jgi:hypothetical protein
MKLTSKNVEFRVRAQVCHDAHECIDGWALSGIRKARISNAGKIKLKNHSLAILSVYRKTVNQIAAAAINQVLSQRERKVI